MLPLLYAGVAPQQILDDVESAPIPELHKAMFRWVKRFVSSSWDMTADDTQALRDAGVSEDEIVNWANIACLQTWWVMSADGGGIPLEGNAVTGPAVQRHPRSQSVLLALGTGGGRLCQRFRLGGRATAQPAGGQL